MIRLMKLLKHNKSVSDFLVLASGSMLGQGMAILFAPILSRIYTQEQMGLYTLVLTAVGMFESAICLRYDLILVSEENDNKIKSLFVSSFRIAIVLSSIITIVYSLILLLSGQVALNQLWLTAFVLPCLICGGLILLLTSLNNRHKEYKNIALASLSQGVTHNGFSAIFGIISNLGVFGLILGRIIGYLSYIIVSCRTNAVKELNKKSILNRNERLGILVDNKEQALFSTPAVIISCVSYSIVNLFLSQLYGTAILGLYSYSYRLLGLPITVISANISRMFFKDASIEYHNNHNMKRSFLKMLVPVVLLTIGMVIVFKLFAPSLFALILGERWREAGVFVQILAPMFGLRLLSNSFANATIVTNKQFITLVLQVLYLFAASFVFLICKIHSFDVYFFLELMNIIFSVINAVYFFVLALLCYKSDIKKHSKKRGI